MGFLLCDSFTLTFVLSRSMKLGFFCLKTLSIMTNLSMHMPGFMTSKHHPFSISIMHARPKKKTCLRFMPSGLQFAKNILMARPARLHLWFFLLIPCPSGMVENRYPPNIGDNTLPKIFFSKFGEFFYLKREFVTEKKNPAFE